MTTASITISPHPPLQKASDYAALREAGLAYIERYSHSLWTDYNAHDPGITLLELLCYAITDLSLRTSLDMKDLLASSFGSVDAMQQHFLTAAQALPTGPVSELDYRKLLIDIDGVRNAWLQVHDKTVFVNCQPETADTQRLQYDSRFSDVLLNRQTSFPLKGLYDILIDYDPVFIAQQVTDHLVADAKTCRDEITGKVRATYQAHRNLCEDVVYVKPVPVQYVMFCADIGLESNAKVSEVYAQILFRVQEYLAPPVKRYSLVEMQARTEADGNPLTIDQIFDGPRLVNGFIIDDELEQSELRTHVYASDLIRIMMGVKGVKDVKKVLMNAFEPETNAPEKSCNEMTLRTESGQRWCLPIDPNHQPQLCAESVALSFFKDIIPVGTLSDQNRALEQLAALQKTAYQQNRKTVEDLPVPVGEVYELQTYSSIANDLPPNYRVGRRGLPASASEERKAQAKQLKAYLLFFDQLLTNYLAQLANLKSFFSAEIDSGDDASVRTYFGQAVADMTGSDELFVDPADQTAAIDRVLAQLEGFHDNPARKNRFLDHLLARFAENFNDYALLMHSFYGERGNEEILEDKASFLADYGKISRAQGYNYCLPGWQTDNVAGIVRRLARLTGIRGNNYQAYYASAIRLEYATQESDNEGNARYRFVLDSSASNRRLLISTDSFQSDNEAIKGMQRTLWPVPAKDRFVIEKTGKVFTYTLRNSDKKSVATSSKSFSTQAEAEAAIEEIIEILIYSGEALFLVEHSLLLPKDTSLNDWMNVCIEPGCSHCEPLDPYSYRVSVILPGYTTRFRNIDYRRYIENLIRAELPAHVLARICWVSREQLGLFEQAYQPWLQAQMGRCADPALANDQTKALVEVLESPDFHTIYETGVLHDCDNPDEETPIILNRTALGSQLLPSSDHQPES